MFYYKVLILTIKNKNNNDNIEFDLHVDVAVEENNKDVIAFMDASKT